jgi:hypothetical protein
MEKNFTLSVDGNNCSLSDFLNTNLNAEGVDHISTDEAEMVKTLKPGEKAFVNMVEVVRPYAFGIPYFHKPTGKKVFISQSHQGNTYTVHQHGIAGSAFKTAHNDIRPWQHGDSEHRVRINSRNEYPFTSFTEAVKFCNMFNGVLLTPIHSI